MSQTNSRRTFLKGALSSTAAVATVAASTSTSSVFASSIKIDGQKVIVETDHGMSAKHFIVRHTLVSKDGEVLGEKTFTPDDEAISSYTLPAGYKGKLYATSFCNKHDFWLAESKV